MVALLTESVDWNLALAKCVRLYTMSLSSRRAWIEIKPQWANLSKYDVALLTESVDWNFFCFGGRLCIAMSLSSRRAWIEICFKASTGIYLTLVALLTESVDWNLKALVLATNTKSGRSPHGERGLKLKRIAIYPVYSPSLSSRRAWIEMMYMAIALVALRSLSSRRAWIEIQMWQSRSSSSLSRSPHGERGLKFNSKGISINSLRRSPHGERGLKLTNIISEAISPRVALLTESVDWNRMCTYLGIPRIQSLSSRRAWIEIQI